MFNHAITQGYSDNAGSVKSVVTNFSGQTSGGFDGVVNAGANRSPPVRHGFSILNDVTSTLWAYINLRLLERPISVDSFTMSPEAADALRKAFPEVIE
jgi:hypothetical protein